jgi:trans-2,3-dihydro-3-hydroxyanthranilate isomerase
MRPHELAPELTGHAIIASRPARSAPIAVHRRERIARSRALRGEHRIAGKRDDESLKPRGAVPIATYEVIWVDTFTSTPLEGNACAVLIDARGLEPPQMQAIAREMNLSETAFVFPSDQADFRVRFFMPVGEIPLAGHPTIATVHALCETAHIAADRDDITLQMPAGIIPVGIDRLTGGAPRYAMSQPAPVFLSHRKRGPTAKALGLKKKDLHATAAPQVVSTGTPQLQIALASLDALDRIDIDRRLLFPAARDFLSVHVFAQADDEFALHARHFADIGDILEDPFTGSATGGMAAFCARYGIIRASEYRVAQGMHLKRPGVAEVRVAGSPPDAIGRITVAGQAITVLRGTLVI